MKKSEKEKARVCFLVQTITQKYVEIFAKHFKYFGGETLSMYLSDYNLGKITYEHLVDNVYKDVTDYESAL